MWTIAMIASVPSVLVTWSATMPASWSSFNSCQLLHGDDSTGCPFKVQKTDVGRSICPFSLPSFVN
jgi:hypothetical protein